MSIDPDRERLHLLGFATWSELEATVALIVSGTLRNDAPSVEAARARAHDLLDQHFDAKIASVTAIRQDVAKQFREG